ncbi:MAG: FAD binding domain-containing protein [Chloroflexi bacterium]|nr:FAD binding domain-containing protein [Chloroflexota bacterium]MCI0580416.1 FAD binding domain-containing protein [Chloroflexota bacterium]MCI0647290.1 FAD binding domain-containing protein [Chloroflexota bacterium]MCI0729715.1 FAD binding domain-containing protein [Chloroflexota bacterium]
MPKKPGAYYRPKTVEEALQLLARPDTVPLAGGTTLLASHITAAVVDLQDLGLDQLRPELGQLVVGAMVRLSDLDNYLAEHGLVGDPASLLRKAIRQAGPNTYRNAATLGGSVAARLPDSELLGALLVLNATLALRRPQGATTLGLVEYLAAAERPAGLITEVSLAWSEGLGNSERVARTPADYPIVSVTLWQAEGETPRLAATGIDDRPVRLAEAEAALARGLNQQTIEEAAAAAKRQASHPGDFRGDAAYRAEMAAVLTRRLLLTL